MKTFEKMQEKQRITTPKKIIPAYVAQRCPVCNGFGTVKHGSMTCGTCEGRGYVLVPTNDEVPPFPGYRNTMIKDHDTWKG